MAAMHHGATAAATALHRRRFTHENISLVKPVFFVYSSSASFPSKQARRRNHLRQKILKTLKNPIIPKLPPANPIVPVEPPPQEIDLNQEIKEFEKSENEEARELQELKEAEVSPPAGVGIDGGIGLAGKDSILKYGWWFVGAFVFQTVCAVLFVGLDDTDNKREIVNGSGELRAVLDETASVKTGLRDSVIGDGNVNVEKLEMERKIEEIRIMAREAREKERLQSNRNGNDGEDGEDDEGSDGGKIVKSGIAEEVDCTMVRLKKKLGKTRFKTPLVVHSNEETKRGGDEVEKGALLYKKKYKYKDFSGDTMEKPKGFVGLDDSRVNGDVKERSELFTSGNGDDDGERQAELSNDDPKGSDAVLVVEEDNKKGISGATESTRNTRSKVTKERGTSRQGKRKGVAKAKVVDGKASDLDAAEVSDKLSTGNGSFRGKGFGNTKSAIKSKSDTGLWWLNLPFVLVIFMQRRTSGKGLYTLKSISSTDEQVSYIVAFEDRVDATNFCYLLESFFEDLGDFKADVAPLTVKELKDAVKSHSFRALVVKRGKLQLYAGQPLADAEMALRAMIEQG
ncbi:uncharacterized protein LOC130991800 isoform X2 [Salvia miltiorrhiza]|uniref:uncharacterized protein LOC130991800 isoform X2 n=1 Tax=Salvia miltiorrhiza TaxID=226208 RepID=UPI0025ACD4C5|nr:uncharacterized protein LOC130991800 isoform X2 [Salvia miltiorrhiza]